MKTLMSDKNQNRYNLDDLEKKNSFQAPEGYFENFNDRLKEKLSSESAREKPERTIVRRLSFSQLAIAASFIGIMAVAYSGVKYMLNRQDQQQTVQQTTLANLSDYPVEDIDESTLYELYNETSTEESSSHSALTSQTDDLIDYLMLEDAEIEVLMQQL